MRTNILNFCVIFKTHIQQKLPEEYQQCLTKSCLANNVVMIKVEINRLFGNELFTLLQWSCWLDVATVERSFER